MTASQPDNEAIFHAARDIPDPDHRRQYVREACGHDEARIAHVEALLAAADGPDSLLDRPAAATPVATTIDLPIPESSRTVIGPYKLIEPIGEGGMGSVWMAQQTEPVKRLVAVKLIKAGMDSRQVIARFEAERQALALMDHPNIARVLDGGTTSHGRPYFVMDLVKGVPITRYCDEHHFTPRQRLELFIPICQAVQHAHQKGIIHRDLKPSNVLVALCDGKPVPKVIDFGVAKAAGQPLTDRTLVTGFGAIVGTLEYMSPEQAEVNQLDIDTRSDIYSLGVLLYVLLTGSPPFSRKELTQAGMLEMLRVIREQEPSKPSTKLSTADGLPTLAANRGTEPAKLTKLVRGELDWIVMKALEKDRGRRYQTANGFAMDVQRYLADEPVAACPPSVAYRVRKFARRNRGPVIAASLVLLALVAGVIGTTVGMLEANRSAEAERQATQEAVEQKRLAELAAAQEGQAKVREAQRADGEKKAKVEAEAKRQEAERNLAFSRKGNEILGSVFAGLHPKQIAESGRPLQDVLRENLGKAVKDLEGSAIGDPLEVAAMQHTLGMSLVGLGEYALAVEVFGKALQTRQAKLGADHPDTLTSRLSMARGYTDAGQLDKALPLLQETLELAKAKLGPDDPLTLATMSNLAFGYHVAKDYNKALPLYQVTLKLMKAKLPRDDPGMLTTINNLAMCYQETGKLDLALPLLQETLELTKAKLPPDHPYTLGSMNNLAVAYWRLKRLDQSIPLFEETLQLQEKMLGRQHPNMLMTVANLGVNYLDAGRLKEAIPLLEEAYRAAKKYPNLRFVVLALLDAYAQAGQNAKLVQLLQEQLAEARQALPKDSPQLANLLAQLGWGLLEQKNWAEAEPLLRECLTLRAKTHPDVWNTFNTMSLLGGALLGQKKYAEAEPLLLQGYEGMKQREKTIPPAAQLRLPEAIDRLIELYMATNRPEEAKQWQAERAKYPSEKK
jgi:serine/threonine protein kinase/tetratricopeptide (TPR) repeat protein